MAEYPEHDKLRSVADDSQRLGAFLDWAQGRGYMIAHWVENDRYRIVDPETGERKDRREDMLVPVHKTVNQWLADFYEIDLQKIEDEKRAMLDELRRADQAQ